MPAGGFQLRVPSPVVGTCANGVKLHLTKKAGEKNYYLHKVGATRDAEQGEKNFKLLLL